MPASWEDKECVDLPFPSRALAVHSVPTPVSTSVDSVANGFVQCDVARQWKVCKMEELDESVVWRQAALLGSIKS